MNAQPKIDFDELRARHGRHLPVGVNGTFVPAPGKRVLDHGWVILADWMGSDTSIVEAARISTGQGTKSPAEDRGLIRYLLRNRHTTPFEMVEFKFIVKSPMFVWRQWIRHRMSSTNEMSGRYVQLPEEFFVPELAAIRKQSKSMKQGRSDEPVDEAIAIDFAHMHRVNAKAAFGHYEWALDRGIGAEISRIGLPLSTYTVAYWKIDLHNLFGFLSLRLDSHAQEEIRVYAQAIAEMIQPIVPMAYEAFEDHRLEAVTWSGPEMAALKAIAQLRGWNTGTREDFFGILDDLQFSKTEAVLFVEKLEKAGTKVVPT